MCRKRIRNPFAISRHFTTHASTAKIMADDQYQTGYCGFMQDPKDDQQRPHVCTAGARCVYAGGRIRMQLEPGRPFAYFSRSPYEVAPNYARRSHIACMELLFLDLAAGPMSDQDERTEARHTRCFSLDATVNPAFQDFGKFFPEGTAERELLSRYYAWIIMHSQTGADFDAGMRGTLRRQFPDFNRLIDIDFTKANLRQNALSAAPVRAQEDEEIHLSQSQ